MLFKLNDIYKSYGEIEILRGVSFQVNPFEKVGLVGRNGAGKTTAFRIVTGEESPDSGEVSRAKDLKIGLLQQHVDFSEKETVHTAALSAFKELHDIEARMRQLEIKMAEDASEEVLNEYAELQIKFETEGGFEYTAKAEAILLGLNFDKESWSLETDKLSGGQKNRLGMVRLLLSDADILLLDEPTNHLDVQTVEWLEDYLTNYDKAYVIISHDRYFLDKTCTKIIEIENGLAYTYKGNYSKYVVDSELQKEQRQREYENQQAYIAKTQAFIRKNLAGQKTKQAKSRRTMLQKMDKLDAVEKDKAGGNFNLKNVERTGANVLAVEDLSIGYSNITLAKNIDFLLHRGECLGVIGGNGTGKTTFLKTILGTIRELSGKIIWGTKINIGYYSQQLEELDLNNDLIAEMRKVNPLAESGELRSFLAGFLFFGEDVFKRVGDLSGGEKGRLSLAKLIYSKANVLILDEPTNHLDIPSREALEEALSQYEGTIITVSHDRYFLDQVATQIFGFEENGKIEIYNGNYSQYHEWKKKRVANTEWRVESKSVNSKPQENLPKTKDQSPKTNENLSKNERQKIEKRIVKIEEEIAVSEENLKKLTLQMSNSEIVANQNEFQNLTKQYQQTEKSIQNLYSEWEELLEKLN
ncbi:MAG: ABC-F family ATP-binding cassette domain-containing protein [Acidobacteriota bacterium]|nr:ABC-F family ATP-binding cassette domain-containing protein [Acidobacteriota bacterium]